MRLALNDTETGRVHEVPIMMLCHSLMLQGSEVARLILYRVHCLPVCVHVCARRIVPSAGGQKTLGRRLSAGILFRSTCVRGQATKIVLLSLYHIARYDPLNLLCCPI